MCTMFLLCDFLVPGKVRNVLLHVRILLGGSVATVSFSICRTEVFFIVFHVHENFQVQVASRIERQSRTAFWKLESQSLAEQEEPTRAKST